MKWEHRTSSIEHPTPDGRWTAARVNIRSSMFVFFLAFCLTSFGSTNEPPVADDPNPSPVADQNARELYNAGTLKLRAGKLDDAEMLLESSVGKQDAQIQPEALFNLGYVRFGQGVDELKKSPGGAATAARSRAANEAGTVAIQNATDALAGNDVGQMVQAYLAGHGVRKEMRAALKAVRSAMDAYGKTLTKWQRALGDFQSAAELNPGDTNAVRNAGIVQQAITRLVDSLRQMQQASAGLGQKEKQLGDLLKQLRGRIPAANMPPGASGEGDEDDDGDGGMLPEQLAGRKESTTGGGQEMTLKISAETAGQLLNSIQPDGKLLPIGQGGTGKPNNRSGRNW
jgi:tetratricopeptide (TPR) repeat protein